MNMVMTTKIWKNQQHWQFPDTCDLRCRGVIAWFIQEHSIQKTQDLWLVLFKSSSTLRTSVSDPEVCSSCAWLSLSSSITPPRAGKPAEYCTRSQQTQTRNNAAAWVYLPVWAADFFLGEKAEEQQRSHPFDQTSQTPLVFPKHPK